MFGEEGLAHTSARSGGATVGRPRLERLQETFSPDLACAGRGPSLPLELVVGIDGGACVEYFAENRGAACKRRHGSFHSIEGLAW